MGQTRDDAAGEAFDKIARVMGLPYPGGPRIDALAKEGKASIDFPEALVGKGNYEFSFSGLKSAVLNYINSEKMKGHELNKPDIAASFQHAVIDVLVGKAFEAVKEAGRDTLVLAGGVAANSGLEARLRAEAARRHVTFHYPSKILCTDNAAMIACRGYYQAQAGRFSDLYLNAVPGLDLEEVAEKSPAHAD
jgi:N6-L-threonylcarbamoyladenine synthase